MQVQKRSKNRKGIFYNETEKMMDNMLQKITDFIKRNGTHDRHSLRCGIGILGAPGSAVRGLH